MSAIDAAWCIECAEQGTFSRVFRKLGAWWCPIHRDLGHITASPNKVMLDRNVLRANAMSGHRSVEEIAPPVPTPQTDAAPPDGNVVKMVMLAGAIKAWWMHRCGLCGRFYDEPQARCCHTGTPYMDSRDEHPTFPMWDSPLHREYLNFRNQFQAALIASQRYATYAPHNAIKGRWHERFQGINDGAIYACDLMVVMSPKAVPTEGTDKEVITAAEADKPVIYIPSDTFTPEMALGMVDEFFDIQGEW